jgi:hypothetical protein
MLTVDLSTIFGISLGFEMADKELCEEIDMDWGFVVDFLIFRLTFSKYKVE